MAAIDVGTNTVRLIVMDGDGTTVEHQRAITRLGQGVDATRALHPDAVERTVAAVDRFVRRARERDADKIRVAGTSVLRDAADSDIFAALVAQVTGVELEILSGAAEGRVAYAGATAGLPPGDYVVCDIGGGSTEIVRPDDATSLDIGSVRLRERCLHSSPPTHGEIGRARTMIDGALATVDGVPAGAQLIGVAGTITTVAALALDLGTYDREVVHHSRLTLGQVVAWSDRLLSMTHAEIADTGSMEAGRADIIAGGCLIFRLVMERWGFDEVLVSETDILDGLALDLL